MKDTGQVQRIQGNVNWVMPDPRRHFIRYPCEVGGKLLLEDTGETTLLCVGDWVEFSYNPSEEKGTVQKVLERETVLVRRSAGESERGDPLVANADLLVIVLGPQPELRPKLVDRYLLGALLGNMDIAIAVNKYDLPETREQIGEIRDIYEPLGYPVLATSAKDGTGLMDLFRMIHGNQAVLAGYSGVGKSTLINRLYGKDLTVAEVSREDRGRHTTTYSAIYRVGNDTWVTDTPGIRSFGVYGIDPRNLHFYFPEFEDYIGECKFSDCTHRDEPGCAIKGAVEEGEIAESRYDSYLDFFDELNELLPEWERVN